MINTANGANADSVIITRFNLIERMKKLTARKNIYLFAPGGYGKTVAAKQLINSVKGAAVFSAGSADNDSGVFYSRLTKILLKLTDQKPETAAHNFDAFLKIVSTLPGKSTDRKYLLIDDLHMIENEDILNSLPVIAKKIPNNIRLCVTSRRAPSDELISTGLFEVLTDAALLFSVNEAEWLAAEKDYALTAEQLNDLMEKTGGWPIYLSALMSDSANYNAPRTLAQYLETRVWNLWGAETKKLLLRIAIPPHITPELCERLTGKNGGADILTGLTRRENAFLSLSSCETYRFHDIFRDFLSERAQKYLGSDEIRRMNAITAEWFYERGSYYTAALYFIRNADHDGINRCMKETNRHTGTDGIISVETLLEFTKQNIMNQPREFIEQNPYLLAKCVGAAFNDGDTDAFIRYADALYRKFPEILAHYPGNIETACLAVAVDYRVPFRDYLKRIIELKPSMVRHTAPKMETRITSVTLNLPYCHRSLRDFSEYHELRGDDMLRLKTAFEAILGQNYEAYENSMRAGLLYEKGELLDAQWHALGGYRTLDEHKNPETIFCTCSILAAILTAMGADREATPIMSELDAYITEKAQFLSANFKALQTVYAIRAGNTDAAKEWLRVYANKTNRPPFYQIFRHFTTVRAYIAAGGLSEAIELGTRLQTMAADYSRPLDLIESAILTSIALNKDGQTERAVSEMQKALRTAAPYGYTQTFINEGIGILPMILKIRGGSDSGLKAFAQTLAANITVSKSAPENASRIKLPNMRRKVLELLDAGLSYNEIAERLGIKHGSVKRHILMTYRQLGVHTAQEAIAAAKTLGLLEMR